MQTKIRVLLLGIAAVFAALANARADTSYLLIQGPFGSEGAEETFKWQVNYPTGDLVTGMDLMNVVFGTPEFSGSFYTTYFGTLRPYWTSTNGALGAGYIDYSGSTGEEAEMQAPFVASVTIDSSQVMQDSEYNNIWTYYVAGGGSAMNYPAGSWTFSGDGLDSRTIGNGTFDAWVFGSAYDTPPVTGTGNDPVASEFAGATVINIVPEPGSTALGFLSVAMSALAFRMRRKT